MLAKVLVKGPAVIGLFFITALLLMSRASHYAKPNEHRIANAPLPPLDFLKATSNRDQQHADYYDSEVAADFCRAHGYSVFKPQASVSSQRKVYDLVMVNTELDFLEIRLNALYDQVDYFIIVESPKSFHGNEKPLIVRDSWERFKPYHDKMVYHKLTFPKDFDPKRTWDYEELQRDAMLDQVFPTLQDQKAPVKGDVIIVADVDEIPRPEAVLVLRSCNYPRRLTISSKFYYYSFQFLHDGPEWQHPQATYFDGPKTIKPANLRRGNGGIPYLRDREKGQLSNAAWHCSSCFPTVEQFLNKMGSFSHTWMNREQYRDKDKIAAAVREGKDLWGRMFDSFTRVDGNEDMPPLVKKEKERFGYMISRDGPSAGFTDYP